jgi:hypothetical protein
VEKILSDEKILDPGERCSRQDDLSASQGRTAMRWSIGKKIGSGFGLALVALTIVGGVSYDSTSKLIDSAEWV